MSSKQTARKMNVATAIQLGYSTPFKAEHGRWAAADAAESYSKIQNRIVNLSQQMKQKESKNG